MVRRWRLTGYFPILSHPLPPPRPQAGKQWSKVEKVVAEMRANGVKPNAMTYTVLITGCAATGRVGRAMQLLAEMRRAGVPPNAYAYTAVISTCTKGGDWRQALQVFEQVRSRRGPT
jgi:pentatricopeptide repeat protein